MTLRELDAWFSGYLDLAAAAALDSSPNGLQVGRRNPEVRKAAFAVDASQESFHRAVDWGADLLVVHHGILWGPVQGIVGPLYERVRFLVERDLALFAAHLPLDIHPEVGNNAGIARALGLVEVEPFGAYKGLKIGCKGTLPAPARIDEITALLTARQGEPLKSLPFGPAAVRRVGIVSGDAPWGALQASAEGLDLFVTGEPGHEIYHHCVEQHIHAIFCGHYHSESWGVRSLAARLLRDTGVETTYLDIPTGL
jgi:dinuclear metal center YbgI/SA1388 family protein